MVESSREKNHDREGPIPPTTLDLLRAMPARIDVEWLFSTPGSADTRRPRIDWPSQEELQRALKVMSYKALSRELGVSDNAIRNRLRAYEAGRQPGGRPRHDGGKLWRYDNWIARRLEPGRSAHRNGRDTQGVPGQLGDTSGRRRRQHR